MKHGRNSFRGSFDVTCACLESFISNGFVQANTLVYEAEAGAFIIDEVEIACLGGIVLTVSKELSILSGSGVEALVQTTGYSYNASVRGVGNILRYDNAHRHDDHPDDHHKHEWPWNGGKTIEENAERVTWVGAANFPHLSEFIEEVQRWYWEHHDQIAAPESYPTLGLRG